MKPDYLKSKHDTGLPYSAYMAAGTPDQQANWKKIDDSVGLSHAQHELVTGFKRMMRVIVLSGRWCGDCVQQGPLLHHIAKANPGAIDMVWHERDDHPDLQEYVRINGGDRVPVVIFCAEDYELVSWYGDRTLCRYRAMAEKQLGGACPMPGAPVPQDELDASLQCWLDEFERVQLLLRLSTRLRKLHND